MQISDKKSSPICIIPARSRSPNLPKKNIKRIAGTPLVAHSVNAAVTSSIIDYVFVSTESKEIARIADEHGARVPFLRPKELAKSSVSIRPVIEHALAQIRDGVDDCEINPRTPVVILQPNIPFRRVDDIRQAVERYHNLQHETVISVSMQDGFFWRESRDNLDPLFSMVDRRRNEADAVFKETGSITVTCPERIESGEWPDSSPGYIKTNWLSSFKIDTLVDFWMAEKIAAGPTICFRTEGGGELGLGKVYRALTLATELEDIFDCDILFISNEEYNEGIEVIRSHEFEVKTVGSSAADIRLIRELEPDVVLIDVEESDEKYHKALHQASAAVFDFENIYDGNETADFVINPQRDVGTENGENYLTGPDYLVLRDEFRDVSTATPGKAENVLLTFGGTDPLGLTVDCIEVLGRADLDFRFKVIVGPGFSHEETLRSITDSVASEFDFHRNVENMGEYMRWADIAISSGGRTVYELAATGTPSMVIAQNNGEVERMQLLREQGAIEFLGHGRTADLESLPRRLESLAGDEDRLLLLSERGRDIVDGQGLQRIIEKIERMFIGAQ